MMQGMLRVFGAPLLLMASSILGLLAALFGDGVWDALSWAALGVPLAVIVRYAGPRPIPEGERRGRR